MCLIVEIRANEKIIETLVATNITPHIIRKGKRLVYGKGKQVYRTEWGEQKLIEHNFEDGALVLALKIIKQELKEQKKGNA